MTDPTTPELPRWVPELVEGESADFALTSVRIADTLRLDEAEFREAAQSAYARLFEDLAGREAAVPVRMWNFIPGILQPLGELPHRYMAFNQGRYEAYLARYGSVEEMERRIPTASGIGHSGASLVIHCLTSRNGQAIENPRQTRASRYSRRYGPRPPCFARATLLQRRSGSWLFVGGTASVVGEQTMHAGDVAGQLAETLRNLDFLVRAASAGRGEVLAPASVRVYSVRSEDEAFLRQTVPEHLGSDEVEFVRADLCRPDLLVEIEALYGPSRETAAARSRAAR